MTRYRGVYICTCVYAMQARMHPVVDGNHGYKADGTM